MAEKEAEAKRPELLTEGETLVLLMSPELKQELKRLSAERSRYGFVSMSTIVREILTKELLSKKGGRRMTTCETTPEDGDFAEIPPPLDTPELPATGTD